MKNYKEPKRSRGVDTGQRTEEEEWQAKNDVNRQGHSRTAHRV